MGAQWWPVHRLVTAAARRRGCGRRRRVHGCAPAATERDPSPTINRVAKVARGQRNKTLFGATADVAKQGDVDDDMVEALETAVGSDELTESKGRGVPGVCGRPRGTA